MYILSQKNSPAILLDMLLHLKTVEKSIASCTDPNGLKDLYERTPRESTLSVIYFKRYLELVEPEALERARSCASVEELRELINGTNPDSLEGEAYNFVLCYEMTVQTAQENAQRCTTELEVRNLLQYVDKESIAQVIYEQRLMELHFSGNSITLQGVMK